MFELTDTFKNQLSADEVNQFRNYPDRPNDYEYALISHSVFEADGCSEEAPLPPGWRVHSIYTTNESRLKSLGIQPIQKDP